MKRHSDGIPIVEVKRKGNQVYFYCQYCKRKHFHGYLEEELSHRVTHCINPDSPYKQTGYYLRIAE